MRVGGGVGTWVLVALAGVGTAGLVAGCGVGGPRGPGTETPPPTGFLRLCADAEAGGDRLTGAVTFGVAGRTLIVPVGACSLALPLPAGDVTITEAVPAGAVLTAVRTTPDGRLVSSAPQAGTARVMIVAGDISTQTSVTFTHRAARPMPGPGQAPGGR